jgi:hypothetical protein
MSRLSPGLQFAGVGEEQMGLGAGEVGAIFTSSTICGRENSSSGEGVDKTELGARAGEEWSGVQKFGVGGRCGVSGGGMHWGRRGWRSRAWQRSNRRRWNVQRGGTDVGRHHLHPSATPPRSVFLPLSSFASKAEARGMAKSRAAMAMAEVVRPAGAQAGSEVLRTASALQHWRPDRIEEGVCGSISRLWRWRLALGKLWSFLVFLKCC